MLKSSPVTLEFRLWKIMSVIFLLSCPIPACARSKELPSSLNGEMVRGTGKKEASGRKKLVSISKGYLTTFTIYKCPSLVSIFFNCLFWLVHFCYCFLCLLIFQSKCNVCHKIAFLDYHCASLQSIQMLPLPFIYLNIVFGSLCTASFMIPTDIHLVMVHWPGSSL